MSNAIFHTPTPSNEPVRGYAPGSNERTELKARLESMAREEIEIPLLIGGREIRTGDTESAVCPHDHAHTLAVYHRGSTATVEQAAAAAAEAAGPWASLPWEERAAIFLRAADLLAGPWRSIVNGATMLGQSKSAHQAEIDAACELIDFFRFNVHYMREMMAEQPQSSPGCWNRVEYRPLEGFVFAVTPFNFTSIAGNLPTAPAMLGNTVIWKPASTAVFSAYYIMKLLEEAGLPPGVINFVPGSGGAIGNPVLDHPDLAGVHFTGSTDVFRGMWKTVGKNIELYRSYPRIVGETGGKDFIFAHSSANPQALVAALVRGAFEYQGQKCSAASRAYVPASIWPQVREALVESVRSIKMGPPTDFRNFMNAVIDQGAFDKIEGYIEAARTSPDAEILAGGEGEDAEGWFIQPTVIQARDPRYQTMVEEIFGPVLTVFVYDDNRMEEALTSCDEASPYGLTGAVFARDRQAIAHINQRLRNTAGNFYVNDKPTGAVVGQQPFGGSRASGTNDKAGSKLNLQRWVSVRTIKENFLPPEDYPYPFMAAE